MALLYRNHGVGSPWIEIREAGAADAAPVAGPTAREVKLTPADVSTGPQGKISLAFSRFGVIDSDGDVTMPGAFPSIEVPLSQWGHAIWEKGFLPIGRGRITSEGDRAIWRGKLFLGMAAARETFEALRELSDLVEVSYGYVVAESDRGPFQGQRVRFLRKVIVHEVSPVLKGAGVRTGLVSLSSLDPLSIEVGRVARDIDVALAEARGFRREARKLLGRHPVTHEPVYESAGGRK